MEPRWAKMGQDGGKMCQHGAKMRQLRAGQDVPTWRQDASTSGYVVQRRSLWRAFSCVSLGWQSIHACAASHRFSFGKQFFTLPEPWLRYGCRSTQSRWSTTSSTHASRLRGCRPSTAFKAVNMSLTQINRGLVWECCKDSRTAHVSFCGSLSQSSPCHSTACNFIARVADASWDARPGLAR